MPTPAETTYSPMNFPTRIITFLLTLSSLHAQLPESELQQPWRATYVKAMPPASTSSASGPSTEKTPVPTSQGTVTQASSPARKSM